MALLTAIALAGPAVTPTTAQANPAWRGVVVVLVSPTDDDVTRNARARFTGELAAAPFQTITLPVDPESDVLSQIERAAEGQSAVAAFAIVRDPEPGSNHLTIWVSSSATGTTTVRRMPVEGDDVDSAARRLAVESVELIRASLAGLWPSPPVAPPPEPVPRARAPVARVAVTLSAGRMTDFGDAPAFWAPQLAVSWGRLDRIGLRLTASGFGPGADVSSDMGAAHVGRTIVTLGLARVLRSDRIVQPTFGVGAGAQRVAVHGTSPAALARDASGVSALAMASVAIAVALGARLAAVIEADTTIAWPASKVRIAGEDPAVFDGPSLFTHVGLRATF
ncbi:MAG TPA: hypothetical protein VHM31_05255 [Polyangia bacterium]|nr:hypothetical protein [Polyangia bacterium]